MNTTTTAGRWAAAALAVALVPLGSTAGRSAEQAGVSAAVRGSVELAREQVVGRQVESGEPIYLQDALRAGADSGMQVMLLDETIFTLGADSAMVIDEFVYDPSANTGKVSAQVVKGAFRFVTGKVARNSPADMEVRLPAGTIGIRGTIVAGVADPTQQSSLVVLLGPGRENNTSDAPGAVRVTNAGSFVDLRRPNFATRIPGPNEPPTPPFQISLQELDALLGQLRAGARSSAAARRAERGGSASQEGGQATAQGGGLAGLAQVFAQSSETAGGLISEQGQDQISLVEEMALNLDGITTLAELATIATGTATYGTGNVPLFVSGNPSPDGAYDFDLMVDFGRQQIDVTVTNITSSTLGLLGESYSGFEDFNQGRGGLADFQLTDTLFGSGTCSPCDILVDTALFNKAGEIAAEADGFVIISGPGGTPEVAGGTGPLPAGSSSGGGF